MMRGYYKYIFVVEFCPSARGEVRFVGTLRGSEAVEGNLV